MGVNIGYAKATLFSLLAFFSLVCAVRADVAPPMMFINVTYNGVPINGTFYSALLTCMNSSNSSAIGMTIQQLNASYYDPTKGCYWARNSEIGTCMDGGCTIQYFSQSDLKAAFYLPGLNGTFVTNEVNASGVTTSYGAQLYPDGSATMEISNGPTPASLDLVFFAIALAFTLAIELAMAFLYLKVVKVKEKGRILLTVVLANVISLPLVWFGFVFLLGGIGLLLGEIFAVVFEGCFIYLLNRKSIKLTSAMLMSLAMNLASLVIGGLILLLLSI